MSRILHINDNAINRFAVARILQHEGFEVNEAETGESGLNAAFKDLPDLILLDIRLPDIDGFEVCRRLKQDARTARIPVVHVTAHALDTENRIQSLELGAEAYLTVPVDRTYLSATVNSLLRLRTAEAEREALLQQSREEQIRLEAVLQELSIERALIEQFVAALTHDLRTPLAAIKLHAELLNRTEAKEEITKRSTRIMDQVSRMDRMIQDLLDVSLLRAGKNIPVKRQTCNLSRLIQELLEDFATTSKNPLRCHGCETSVEGNWDPAGLHRVLSNLIQNAFKYGAPDGPVTVKVESTPQSATVIVHNEGDPIPGETADHLFKPFHRSTEARRSGKRGWGLGLAIVKGIIDAHQGELTVQSTAETGTTFSFKLPKQPQSIEVTR